MGAKGAAQATLSFVDGETGAEGRNALAHIGFYRGIAMFAIIAQHFQHVRDHVDDGLAFRNAEAAGNSTSVVYGKSVSVRVDIGGRRIINKKKVGASSGRSSKCK